MQMKSLTKVPEAKIPMKNSEPPYALVVIDIFSKMGDVPMKQRDGETVLRVEANVQDGFSNVQEDVQAMITEHFKQSQSSLKVEAINHITRTHANVVERFIRTLKGRVCFRRS